MNAVPGSVARRPLRVAVVGAGPAGIYTADSLTFERDDILVDVIERLPEPFGLLRFGVAPDHLTIKSAAGSLQQVLDRPGVRLLCNTQVGTDVKVEDLRAAYDAVVYATGADADRSLTIPGEDLPGSTSATAFVKWYNGHPEADAFDLAQTRRAVVVGAGNVALDACRILLKDPGSFTAEMPLPAPVREALRASAVTDVHLLARRGPQDAKFTSKELGELLRLERVATVVDARDLTAPDANGFSPMARRNLKLLEQAAERDPGEQVRRLHLHFHTRPVAIEGNGTVAGVRVEHGPDSTAGLLDADLVLRAVGYRSRPVDGIPHAEETATIPHVDHRVIREGEPSAGEYAVGWAKRGPTGILGRNRSDADDTAQVILDDLDVLLALHPEDPGGLADFTAQR